MGKTLVTGVDIGRHSIKAVVLTPYRESYSLLGCQEIVISEDIFADNHTLNYQKIVKKLKELKKGLPLFSRKVTLAVPDSAVITKQIQIDSNLDLREQEFAVYDAFSQQSPLPLDALQLDYVMDMQSKEHCGQQCQVYATRSEVVHSRMAALRGAGFQPLQLALLSQALGGLWLWFSRCLGRRDGLLVEVGPHSISLCMQLPQGSLYYKQLTLEDERDCLSRLPADELALVEGLRRELQRLSALHGPSVVTGLWLCGTEATPGICDVLTGLMPCQLLPVLAQFAGSARHVRGETQAGYALAAGLALSGVRWLEQAHVR